MLIARARMARPLLLVLDEPCAGMDPGVRERFLAWLEQLASRPTTPAMIMATHHVEEIMPSFDQTLILATGQIASCGTTAEVITARRLEKLYHVGALRLERSGGRMWPIWNLD